MLEKRLLSALTVAVMLAYLLPVSTGAAEKSPKLVDSGIDYTEDVRTVNNPGAGYTTTVWYTLQPGESNVLNPQGNLVLLFVDIGAYSSGVNGTKHEDGTYTEGKDFDLDPAFFKSIRGTLENCRKNGSTVALRFRYDSNGKTNPEPSSFEQVLHHIDQIREDGFLYDYNDILMFVESGFVGAWGEQHSGKYTTVEYKAKLLQAVLDMVPDYYVPVTVRTPDTFAAWAGIKRTELADWTSEEYSQAMRVGMYDDGYMGSDSDLGTYVNRDVETAWLGRQATRSYFGGEFSGNLDWAKKYDTYLPEIAVPEMYKTHLSYINSNIYALYKDYQYTKALDPYGINEAYYGQTVYQFVRDHLGYRFVLHKSELSDTVEQGGTFQLDFDVLNTGFANPIRRQNAELILEKDGQYYCVEDGNLDDRDWVSGKVSQEQLSVKIPGAIEPGDWNVYLRLSYGAHDVADANLRCVEFANKGIWNSALGANRLGTIHVTESKDADQKADQSMTVNGWEGVQPNPVLCQLGVVPVIDGERTSDTEWTADACQAESDGNSLYVSNDDQYLYIAAEIHHRAAKPVINLRVEHGGTTYWYYRQQNGFIYYKQGNHDGITLKSKGDFMEFRIPFGAVMGLSAKTVLDKVTIFIQDEADEWKGCGTLTAEQYTITPRFGMYTVPMQVILREGSAYQMRAIPTAEDSKITWYLNDERMTFSGNTLLIGKVTPAMQGVYTVRIETKDGTVTLPAGEITDVLPAAETLRGDLNLDGTTDAKDAKLLTDWLHGRQVTIKGNADLNADGVWDVFDLALLKQLIH